MILKLSTHLLVYTGSSQQCGTPLNALFHAHGANLSHLRLCFACKVDACYALLVDVFLQPEDFAYRVFAVS